MFALPIVLLKFTDLHSGFSQIQVSCNLLSEEGKWQLFSI